MARRVYCEAVVHVLGGRDETKKQRNIRETNSAEETVRI